MVRPVFHLDELLTAFLIMVEAGGVEPPRDVDIT